MADIRFTDNFSLSEFACKSGAPTPKNVIDNLRELAQNLQVLRDHLKSSIRINSGYRSPAHNKKIGGAKNSQHVQGRAADIAVAGFTPKKVKHAIEALIAKGAMKQGGIGLYKAWVHYDTRGSAARWNG